jgi:hypothetical protein
MVAVRSGAATTRFNSSTLTHPLDPDHRSPPDNTPHLHSHTLNISRLLQLRLKYHTTPERRLSSAHKLLPPHAVIADHPSFVLYQLPTAYLSLIEDGRRAPDQRSTAVLNSHPVFALLTMPNFPSALAAVAELDRPRTTLASLKQIWGVLAVHNFRRVVQRVDPLPSSSYTDCRVYSITALDDPATVARTPPGIYIPSSVQVKVREALYQLYACEHAELSCGGY